MKSKHCPKSGNAKVDPRLHALENDRNPPCVTVGMCWKGVVDPVDEEDTKVEC